MVVGEWDIPMSLKITPQVTLQLQRENITLKWRDVAGRKNLNQVLKLYNISNETSLFSLPSDMMQQETILTMEYS